MSTEEWNKIRSATESIIADNARILLELAGPVAMITIPLEDGREITIK